MTAPRVDFYVLPDAAAAARLKFACRCVAKAWRDGETVGVRVGDEATAAAVDDLLWTYSDSAFVPHERAGSDDAALARVVIGLAPGDASVLLNLADDAAPADAGHARIVEIIDADPTRRQAGRDRFRQYRERGWQPATHNVSGDDDA